MSIRILDNPEVHVPVMFDILDLERLVRAARLQNLRFYINTLEDRAYRYKLVRPEDATSTVASLRSNDIGDVARYVGIDDLDAEGTLSTEGQRPTLVYQFDDQGVVTGQVEGYVPLQDVDRTQLQPPRDLPRLADGKLDIRSVEFWDRTWALYQKTRRGMQYARIDLLGLEGDIRAAEAKLSTPGRRPHCI